MVLLVTQRIKMLVPIAFLLLEDIGPQKNKLACMYGWIEAIHVPPTFSITANVARLPLTLSAHFRNLKITHIRFK